ncbi:NADH:flavin oxidoreductase/NADH oxidase [Cupriavidus nantongensis]|uniref:NADH:flavin oxidoreductase / NADH oxidase n=1 Tax=Cupriavidus nantongensis TaxID=1796606 RepID=A0A142JHY2_9BURK|nr:NADH:flavin oxidoreductase/NADH oxidase [Cupriavidus nantongensis]AMR77694.1 NADH:flavin oxidoreductase / NADH oxidase [Cupriavidus nantongensis]AMR79255.1 NADH:flavin oxidoreductase / NADH oxidase [Cupriavidus nantongensis]
MDKTLLWSPIKFRTVELKNRVVISPMCMYSAQEGMADDLHLVHLGRFALGGAGLVFVEATAVSAQGRITPGCLGLWSDEQVAPLKRITDFVHRFDAAVGIQLSHSGDKGASQRPWEGGGPLSASESAHAVEQGWATVGVSVSEEGNTASDAQPLTEADLHQIISEFVASTERANAAGFDVLELHCAHGYLLHSFLSPLSNHRLDRFGGSLENRMRFPLEVVEAVRKVWPASKPLFVRISSVDGLDAGWGVEDSVSFATELRKLGVDAVDCSSGGMVLPKDKQLVGRTPGYHVPYARRIREEVGVRTVAVGLIRDPSHAQQVLDDESADLIAIAREALFNPNWASHAALFEQGNSGWEAWVEQHGWWLKRRARQQDESFEHLGAIARSTSKD